MQMVRWGASAPKIKWATILWSKENEGGEKTVFFE